MSDTCFSKTNGLSESRLLCGHSTRLATRPSARDAAVFCDDAHLVLIRLQDSGDVVGRGRLQIHQLLLQVRDLYDQKAASSDRTAGKSSHTAQRARIYNTPPGGGLHMSQPKKKLSLEQLGKWKQVT